MTVLTAKEHGLVHPPAAVIANSKSCAAFGVSRNALPAELRQSKDTSKRLEDGSVHELKTDDQLTKPKDVWLTSQLAFPLQRIPTTSVVSAMQEDEGCGVLEHVPGKIP
jgi:hypothetical protein